MHTSVAVEILRSESRPDGSSVHSVAVEDPSQRSATAAETREMFDRWNAATESGPPGVWQVRPTFRDGELVGGNEAAQEFYAREAARAWASTMGTARALYPLQRLEDPALPSGELIDEVTRRYMREIHDGIGIRTRAAVMTWLLGDMAAGSRRLTWVSLACGAAVPVLDALSTLGSDARLTLVDLDDDALAFADVLARRQGLVPEYDFQTVRMDLRRHFIAADSGVAKLGEGEADVVDALGITEYIDARHAAPFLRNAHRLLRPGGRLITSNMLASRPQAHINRWAVGWRPEVKMRSLDEIAQIICAAGIDAADVTYYLPEDGVYCVVEITRR
jgi:SAM-dependent methyltransferase